MKSRHFFLGAYSLTSIGFLIYLIVAGFLLTNCPEKMQNDGNKKWPKEIYEPHTVVYIFE
jgi:hypothetical protein